MVLFSMLRASNYHYNKGPLKVQFIKCKTIHSGFLLIPVIHSILLGYVIEIIPVSIIARYIYRGTFAANSPLTYEDSLIFVVFYIKLPLNFVFSQISNLFFCSIFCHKFFGQSKKSINFGFNQQQQVQTKITITPTQQTLKYREISEVSISW